MTWLPDLLVLLLAVGLAVGVTWPLVLHFGSQVPGDLLSDRDQNLWNLWWVKWALLDHPTNLYHTPLLYYPDGVDLYAHTLALPNGLIGLIPQVLGGLAAAYNTVILFALVLAIYGGFRLVRYVVARGAAGRYYSAAVTGAALAGGIAFGLNTYGLDALKGQTEVLSYGWMPLYAEAWLRAWDTGSRRAALLAGVFFAITLLTNFYYAVYLALFSLVYLAWRALTAARTGGGLRAFVPRAAPLLGLMALPGLVLLPYLAGLANSVLSHTFALDAAEQQAHTSADLLSFLVPPRVHPWLGAGAPWWGVVNPAVHDYVWPGWIAPGLGIIGLIAQRRNRAAWGWALGAGAAAVLALGPVLQINGTPTIPLPWALLQGLPVFSYIGKVERFLVLTRLLLAPLIGWGTLALLMWSRRKWAGTAEIAPHPGPRPGGARELRPDGGGAAPLSPTGRGDGGEGGMSALPPTLTPRQVITWAVLLGCLLLELPIVPRPTTPLDIPAGFAQIAGDQAGGALLEVPLATGQVRTMGARMCYQTAHHWPIIGGYLARSPVDALPECAPVWGLITWEPGIAAADIITPHIMSAPLALMQRLNIRYYAVYNVYDPAAGNPLSQADLTHFQALAAATSDPAPVAQDATVTLYHVRPDTVPDAGPVLQLGGGWGGIEDSGGQPFRWMQGADAAVCVQGAAGQTVRLALRATSFAQPRTLELGLDGRTILTGTIPAGGGFLDLTTPPLPLTADAVRLTLHVPEGSATPAGLGQGNDQRPLSLGFTQVRLEVVK
jgi:hypothetical protein